MQHRNTPRQVTPSNGPVLSAVPRSIRPPGVAPPRFSATPRPMGMQNASRGPTPTGGQATPQMQPRMGQQMATPRPMGRGFGWFCTQFFYAFISNLNSSFVLVNHKDDIIFGTCYRNTVFHYLCGVL